ncbi:unnamed protein product, partial [Symbiodinium sp. KB8]
NCRTGTWARSSSCRQPIADLGWGFFEKHRGQIRIPYYPTSDSTCGVDVPDEVLSQLGWHRSPETYAMGPNVC